MKFFKFDYLADEDFFGVKAQDAKGDICPKGIMLYSYDE
jgi:hypothetical protein